MIVARLKNEDLVLTRRKHDSRCTLNFVGSIELHKFGELLGIHWKRVIRYLLNVRMSEDIDTEGVASSVETEQGLREIYYDTVTGYQSAERLYRKALEEGLDVSRKSVKEWLRTQDTYTRYKPVVRRHKFRKTWVRELGEQIQLDLVDMGKYKDKNKGYYWILTAIEILSRYAFAIPVYRKDTKSMTGAVEELLRQFYDRFGVYPKLAQF